MLSAFALHSEGGLDFLGGISGIEFIAEVADRRHIKFRLYGGIYIVVDSDKPHIIFGEYNIGVHPDLQIVPAKPGHIFDDNCSYLAAFNQLFHFPERRTVEARPRIAVINEELQMFEAVLSRIFL